MSNHLKSLLCALATSILMLVYVLGIFVGNYQATQEFFHGAIKAGRGEYYMNAYGVKEWRWK